MKKSIYINIITPFTNETFLRQLPNSLNKEGFLFFENSVLDYDWDVVVVYEGIKEVKKIKCREGGLIFISGEPPDSMSYSNYFLKQFDHIISSHKNLNHKNNHSVQQALPWHFGISHKTKVVNYNFEDLEEMDTPQKRKKVAIITSNKLMMPGHLKRMEFLNSIKNRFAEDIDIYGHGINPIDDKAEALLDYQFNICIENSSINDYWTEKIADPILAYSIPIYHGCKNISDYFDKESIITIDINNITESLNILEEIIVNSDKIYKNKFKNLAISRDKLLYEHNLFHMLSDFYLTVIKNKKYKIKTFTIKPINLFKDQKIKISFLRFKRLFKKYLSLINSIN